MTSRRRRVLAYGFGAVVSLGLFGASLAPDTFGQTDLELGRLVVSWLVLWPYAVFLGVSWALFRVRIYLVFATVGAVVLTLALVTPQLVGLGVVSTSDGSFQYALFVVWVTIALAVVYWFAHGLSKAKRDAERVDNCRDSRSEP